jgi:hypothetical protein
VSGTVCAARRTPDAAWVVAALALLAGCAAPRQGADGPGLAPAEARSALLRVLPERLDDRAGWAADIHGTLVALALPPTPSRLCAVVAVTEQESGFRVDPAVLGLAGIARREIDRRADELGVPDFAVRAALALRGPDGRSFGERLERVRTERELSEIWEDLIRTVPLGERLLAGYNPVRTGGPMQVSIAFAEAHAARRAYPYPLRVSVRREVFTRHGGLYFGTAHLLDYAAPYEHMLYRFADFNAGHWASRNAAFQAALAHASGRPLALDGDLLPGTRTAGPGQTEAAALALAGRLGMSERDIGRDLELGTEPGFEDSTLHRRVFELADTAAAQPLPRAVVPRIDLRSPKFTRKLTTEWFATRVDERYRRCMTRIAPADD